MPGGSERKVELLNTLCQGLAQPLLRLLASMSVGILIANTLEALAWERPLARLAAPLVRLARMGQDAGSAFVMSFFSAYSSSALLSSAYAEGRAGKKELVLSNIFNSFPSYLVHLPNVAAVAVAVLGRWGVIYIAVGLFAALLRTLITAALGHFILPRPDCADCFLPPEPRRSFRQILHKIFGSFKRRLLRVLKFTIPIYVVFFCIQYWGGFKAVERFMAEHTGFLSFLKPEAVSIVILSLGTETSASMGAAAALLHAGTLSGRDIVLAMLLGNILSSPVRAFRHQLPIYAGYFPMSVAWLMVLCNQTARTASLILALALYYFFF